MVIWCRYAGFTGCSSGDGLARAYAETASIRFGKGCVVAIQSRGIAAEPHGKWLELPALAIASSGQRQRCRVLSLRLRGSWVDGRLPPASSSAASLQPPANLVELSNWSDGFPSNSDSRLHRGGGIIVTGAKGIVSLRGRKLGGSRHGGRAGHLGVLLNSIQFNSNRRGGALF